MGNWRKRNIRILHLTWMAFFVSFIVWFNHAPLMASIRDAFDLTDQQVKTLLILNVALTIPARIVIGMLVDAFGPRRMYSLLLFLSGLLCFAFAYAENYGQLALLRFLLGFVGAGFVIGIRMISEWFPAKQVGVAEGLYGGWGNFGSAAAAMSLPAIALALGGENGWRYAIALTGVMALVYAGIYFHSVTDTPKGSTYFKPKKNGALEVTSRGDFFLYLAMNLPLYAALGLIAWKLGPSNLAWLSANVTGTIYAVLTALYGLQVIRVAQINRQVFSETVPLIHRYKLKQVAVLNLTYMVSFGSELAVVSMLPLFFQDSFGLSQIVAGILGGSYAFIVLFARPGGGLISDRFGRKKTLGVVLVGTAVGYLLMGMIDASWPLVLVLIVTITCALFVHAGNGAVVDLSISRLSVVTMPRAEP